MPTRWRILDARRVERSSDGGASWEPATIDAPATLTAGASPSALVCWLVGRTGVVLLATDGLHFQRVPFPRTTDLSSIRAIDARQATVTMADGAVLTTVDGGLTWR